MKSALTAFVVALALQSCAPDLSDWDSLPEYVCEHYDDGGDHCRALSGIGWYVSGPTTMEKCSPAGCSADWLRRDMQHAFAGTPGLEVLYGQPASPCGGTDAPIAPLVTH